MCVVCVCACVSVCVCVKEREGQYGFVCEGVYGCGCEGIELMRIVINVPAPVIYQ